MRGVDECKRQGGLSWAGSKNLTKHALSISLIVNLPFRICMVFDGLWTVVQ